MRKSLSSAQVCCCHIHIAIVHSLYHVTHNPFEKLEHVIDPTVPVDCDAGGSVEK